MKALFSQFEGFASRKAGHHGNYEYTPVAAKMVNEWAKGKTKAEIARQVQRWTWRTLGELLDSAAGYQKLDRLDLMAMLAYAVTYGGFSYGDGVTESDSPLRLACRVPRYNANARYGTLGFKSLDEELGRA